MAHVPRTVVQRFLSYVTSSAPQDETDEKKIKNDGPFSPSPVDLVVVKMMITKGKRLPPGIVDSILDFAEYWIKSSNEIDFQFNHGSPLIITGQSPGEDKFLIRSFPVGLTDIEGDKDLSEVLAYDLNEAKPQPLSKEHESKYFSKLANYPTPTIISPVRKVVFSIRSRDQGWGGERENRHTFGGSWTWFDAGLERFDADQECDPMCTYDVRYKSSSSNASPLPVCALRPLYPSIVPKAASEKGHKFAHTLHRDAKWEIQRNKTADKNWQDHVVTWSYTDDIEPDSEEARKLDEELGRGRETGDGRFVRDLKMGDVVTVWGKARFGGWANRVEKVKIEVFWTL